jgi:hypothetical protein
MSNRSGRVFLLCSRRPVVAEFLLLAEALAVESDLVPVLVVPQGLFHLLPATLPVRCEVLTNDVPEWRRAHGWGGGMYGVFGVLRKVSQGLKKLGLALIGCGLETWEAVARGRWMARHILALHRDGLAVVTGDDRDIRSDQGILAVARSLRLFTLVVAFGKSDPDADAVRRAQPPYDVDQSPHRWLKRWIARRDPASVRRDVNGRALLFLHLGDYLALRLHGIRFPVPWSYGGGLADRVAVHDESAWQLLTRLGVPEEKLLVAGQCSHDILWSTRTRRTEIRGVLAATLGIDAERSLVVLALPPLSEHGLAEADVQREEAEFLFATLAQTSAGNAVVSLHPRQMRADYEPLAARHGVSIVSQPLRDVLAAADVFVAYSSTIAWAQLLQIPSVALEYYGLGYTLFENQPGVTTVREREGLAAVLADLVAGREPYSSMVSDLSVAAGGVPFDGQARHRLVAEIRTRTLSALVSPRGA